MYPISYGSYTLLESIGKGGMSAIELAQTSVANAQYVRFLVIKRMQNHLVVDDSYIRMFQDEARINSELQHANIAQVYDFGQIGEEFFIAMEYIPGVDLRELQKALAQQRRGIPIRITIRILWEVLSALQYAHNRVDTFGKPMNIVHRDVNPRNVMLSIRGEVKLIDFGVAKAETKLDKTVGHMLKGKFAYMSPEQFEAKGLDGRADLFAVGLMLHEMVEGKRPFKGMSEMQIMHRIVSGDITMELGPRDHPQPELIKAVHNKSLTKDPNDRFASAEEMKKALEKAGEACGGMASPSELASFIHEILPKRSKQISDRLHSYRQDITDSVSIEMPKSKVAAINQETDPDIETLVVPPATVAKKHPFDKGEDTYPRTVVLSILGMLTVFGFSYLLLNKDQESELPPMSTQVNQVKEPVEEKQIKAVTIEDAPSKDQSNGRKYKDVVKAQAKEKAVQKKKKKPAPTATKAKPVVKASPKEPDKNESSVAKNQDEIAKQIQARMEEDLIRQHQEQLQKAKEASKAEPVQTPPAKVQMIRVYLSVGVTSGTKGLPVLIGGKKVTTTGSKKMVSLALGDHQLSVTDPSSGKTFSQTVTIEKGTNQKTVKFKGL